MRRGCEAQEEAILPLDEALLTGEFVVPLSQGMLSQPCPILLVSGQVGQRIDAVSSSRGSLVRREISNQIGAARRNRLAPISGIIVEGGSVVWIEFVADKAGDLKVLRLVPIT